MPLRSGAIHYWRLESDHWRACLESLKHMGFPMVETYIPWGVHEQADGSFDFGDGRANLHVRRFIDLCEEVGLYLFVRPGPHINAELKYFGLPKRVVFDRRFQARSPKGNPVLLPLPPRMFPVPSYASDAFHLEVGSWFDRVGEQISDRLYPNGPIVLVQIDNEASFYFRSGVYDQDYHPDAIRDYLDFLKGRYGSLSDLNGVYKRDWTRWEEVRPPTKLQSGDASQGVVRRMDWSAFQERLIQDSIDRMRGRLEQAGVRDLPTVHNVSLGDGGLPLHAPRLARAVDLVGFDYYHPPSEHDVIKRRTLYLEGTFGFSFAPELGAGYPPWFHAMRGGDSIYCAMTAAAFGMRAFNLYMAVDRNRWIGAPVRADGTLRSDGIAWRSFVQACGELNFETLDRRPRVALVIPPLYRRLSRIAHMWNGFFNPTVAEALVGSPVCGATTERLGFRRRIQIEWWTFLQNAGQALTELSVPYSFIDGDAPEASWDRYDLLVVPTFEMTGPNMWRRLAHRAEQGKRVLYGPDDPEVGRRLEPHGFEVLKGALKVPQWTADEAKQFFREEQERLSLGTPVRVRPHQVDATVHFEGTTPRVLFVMNPGETSLRASVWLHAPCRLWDVINGDRFEHASPVDLPIPGATCRMFMLEPVSNEDAGVRPGGRPSARRGSA